MEVFMKWRTMSVFVLVLTAWLVPSAHAQWTVFDPTNYANAVKEFKQLQQLYTTANQTRDQITQAYNLAYQMSRMPQNLYQRYQAEFSQWTNLSSPNTYSNTSDWVDALNFGNLTRALSAYEKAVIQLPNYPATYLSAQDAATQTAIKNQYASSELGQATLTSALSTIGTIRANSEALAEKLRNLESDTFSTDLTQQTEMAVLGKMNSAALLQLRSQQDANQILAASAAQQALDAKERMDERNRLINQAIFFRENFSNTMQTVTGGVSNAIRAISLSTTGR
jgi:hypothetical protein